MSASTAAPASTETKGNPMEEVQGLDMDLPPFIYLQHQSGKVYKVDSKAAMLSKYIKATIETDSSAGSETKPIVIAEQKFNETSMFSEEECLAVMENRKPLHNYITINQMHHLDYVFDYLNDHATDADKADYCKEECIKTDNLVELIPNQQDREKLVAYVDNQLALAPPAAKARFEDPKTGDLAKKYYKLIILNYLMSTADNYLAIDSLTHILYNYAAQIMWRTPMPDLSSVVGDPYFSEIQRKAIAKYEEDNKEQIDKIKEAIRKGEEVAERELKKAMEATKAATEAAAKAEADAEATAGTTGGATDKPAATTEPADDVDDADLD